MSNYHSSKTTSSTAGHGSNYNSPYYSRRLPKDRMEPRSRSPSFRNSYASERRASIGDRPVSYPPVSHYTSSTQVSVKQRSYASTELEKYAAFSEGRNVSERSSTSVPRRNNHVKPSVRSYRDKRAAFKVLDKIHAIPERERTEKQIDSLNWAKSILAKLETKKTVVTAIKRQRSLEVDEKQHSLEVEKRQRSLEVEKRQRSLEVEKRQRSLEVEKRQPETRKTKSKRAGYSEPHKKVSHEDRKNHIVLAIIDRGSAGGSIPQNLWKLVEINLCKTYKKILERNPGSAPECRNHGWHRGHIKLMACADQRSASLLKQALAEIGEIWPGARLEAVSRNDIPSPPCARSWIPNEPSSSGEILELIQLSNPNLPTKNWKVTSVSEAKGSSRYVTIVVNEESLALLELQKGVISYGFSSITLKINKKDKPKASRPKEDPPEYKATPIAVQHDQLYTWNSTEEFEVQSITESVEGNLLEVYDSEDDLHKYEPKGELLPYEPKHDLIPYGPNDVSFSNDPDDENVTVIYYQKRNSYVSNTNNSAAF